MLAHHVSREPVAADRGRAFGAAQRDAIAHTVGVYRRLLQESAGLGADDMRAAGATVGETLDRELVEELDGMAAGAGQDARDLLAVNARTELLAGAECSVVGRLEGAEVTLAQTWDWHPDLAPSRVLWTVHHGDGAWFTTATEAGVLAKLGLNHHGVACALNLLTCSADGGVGGVPIHVLLRLVLERGEDAEHAARLLCAARATASSAITLASPGSLLAVELSPGGATVLRPDADGWLIHTNHFLVPPAAGVDEAEEGTRLRRARLLELARAGTAPEEALTSHLPEEQPVCRHGDDTRAMGRPDPDAAHAADRPRRAIVRARHRPALRRAARAGGAAGGRRGLRSPSKESARPDAPDPRRRLATRRLAHNPTMGFTIVRRPASTARPPRTHRLFFHELLAPPVRGRQRHRQHRHHEREQHEAAVVLPPRAGERLERQPDHEHERDADRQRDRLAQHELAQRAHQAATGSRESAAIWPHEAASRVPAT